jgi:hypothetical protein
MWTLLFALVVTAVMTALLVLGLFQSRWTETS